MPKAIPQRASRRTPRLSLLGILGLIALWIGATPALGQSSDQPVNDDFDDAIELVGQDVSRPDDSNAGATKETGEDDHGGQPGGATVWYRWTPSISRPVTIDTFGSNFDTNLAVYTGSSVDGLELIKTNDDSGAPEGPFQSRLSFDASAGTTYRIVVDGYRSTDGTIAQGTVGLNLEQLPPPPDTAILSGPAGTVPESETTAGFEFSGAAESFSYECRLDPDEGGEWSGCSSPYTVSDLSKGEHALEVRAFNRGGPDPTPARREWIVGAPSPTPETMIQAAPNGTVDYDETAANISFTAAGRNRGFECRLDSNSDTGWSSCTSPTRITDLERGEHNFEVRAISPGGVADATPAQASWTISPPPVPDTTIDSGPASETYERSAELTFSAMGDADGFECRLNSVEATDWEACSSPYRAYELGFGAHSFEVRAFNSSGADASPAHYEWSVIAPPAPETRIDAGPSGTVSEDRVGFLFSGEGTVDGFECRLDSDSPEDWASCASPRSLSGLADGEHAFEVRAVNAGGPDPTPASRTWTVDTRPELADTVIDAGPGESTTESSAGFSFSAVGVADGFECPTRLRPGERLGPLRVSPLDPRAEPRRPPVRGSRLE